MEELDDIFDEGYTGEESKPVVDDVEADVKTILDKQLEVINTTDESLAEIDTDDNNKSFFDSYEEEGDLSLDSDDDLELFEKEFGYLLEQNKEFAEVELERKRQGIEDNGSSSGLSSGSRNINYAINTNYSQYYNSLIPEDKLIYNTAKAWYAGNPRLPDDKIPSEGSGNIETLGKYAQKVVQRANALGEGKDFNTKFRLGIAGVEGVNNKINTVTSVKAKDGSTNTAAGKMQITKGTRSEFYKDLGVSQDEGERLYFTDPAFQTKVENKVIQSKINVAKKVMQSGGYNGMTPEQKVAYLYYKKKNMKLMEYGGYSNSANNYNPLGDSQFKVPNEIEKNLIEQSNYIANQNIRNSNTNIPSPIKEKLISFDSSKVNDNKPILAKDMNYTADGSILGQIRDLRTRLGYGIGNTVNLAAGLFATNKNALAELREKQSIFRDNGYYQTPSQSNGKEKNILI